MHPDGDAATPDSHRVAGETGAGCREPRKHHQMGELRAGQPLPQAPLHARKSALRKSLIADQGFTCGAFAVDDVIVKKSSSGICHCPGGQYYDRTQNFTEFRSIDECLESGGRHPKQGQGDCPEAAGDPPREARRITDSMSGGLP